MGLQVATEVLSKLLSEYVSSIVDKASKGGRLTSTDAVILIAALTQREFEDLSKKLDDTNTRIDHLERRVEQVRVEVLQRISDVRAELLGKIEDTNKRIDDTNKRVDEVKADLSSKITALDKK
ncbi:hypothetical protein B9Q04_04855 [Candidatus Marsarchaeota G2 archaeon BE_D]|uniref:Uncharacterized protein n=1 Tax=Candidatus Marsarchaeota G2 archaeon BE_D TaxID=1978158 RepID=A0A2R6CCF7_9ARCH|nr:MAG: hypothetical protein B9Q04_04855 [Candidatus Marsarchaeota G2 archaeon BE_D]